MNHVIWLYMCLKYMTDMSIRLVYKCQENGGDVVQVYVKCGLLVCEHNQNQFI